MAKLVWFLFMATISVVVAMAEVAPPSEDCNSVLMDMSDCLSFMENGSTVPRPSTSCCNGFKKVLRNNPQCICEAFYNQNGLPIPIDMNKAMSLPAACKATGPIPCIIPGANGPSPAPSPSGSIPTPAPKKSPPSHSPAPEQPNPPTATVPAPSPSTSEDVNAPAPAPERSAASALSIPSSVAFILAVLALVDLLFESSWLGFFS